MKCMQMNLFSRLEGQEIVSTRVDRTNSHITINTIAIVSGILIIVSSIAACMFLGADMGLLSAILLGMAIIAGLLLIALGVYFCYQSGPEQQATSHAIEQARVVELSQQLDVANHELVSLRLFKQENARGIETSLVSIPGEQRDLLQEKCERIVQLDSTIHEIRREHAQLLERKDQECYREMVRQTDLRLRLDHKHQQEMESKERSTRERMQLLESELTNQETEKDTALAEVRQTLLQNQEKFNQELQEKDQQISDLRHTVTQQQEVDADHIQQLKDLLKAKEEALEHLQSTVNYYENLETDTGISSLTSALVRIRQQEECIALLETLNLQPIARTRNRFSSI
ncbi:TMH family membrane protein [Chlamydia abortus]|uniref:IncA family protein n=1 Tax=Chlamydia abortus TaxID=83555 RepID=UPI000A27CAE7|nr:IncA family protein [Chlamydia abortus]SGA09763.1 TMH family membrane protein [Chlamydia abortus]SGA15094.1 TMH family membrane protein [Chlamydia abortus]SGA17901.1 TMH family membrane protein [Chlamydia abortus]SHD79226.1 TMH family membrane protein [Chlamydia abortus]